MSVFKSSTIVEEEDDESVEDDASVEDDDKSEVRSLSRLVAELFCVVVSPDCTALSSVARSETKEEDVESEPSDEDEEGGGGGACKWLSILVAVDCAVVVSPDCTAETNVCRSERKPDWPSEDEVDDESDVDEDCCSRLCRLVAAVLAVSVSPDSTAFSRLATVEAKLESEDELSVASVELVDCESLAKSIAASWPEPALRKSIADV
jgi:hypothetical protein